MGFARPVSAWVHSSASARTVAADGAEAVQAALQYPGQIATLILPADTAWLEADRPAPALPKPRPRGIDRGSRPGRRCAQIGRKAMMLIRGAALKERGLDAAAASQRRPARGSPATHLPRVASAVPGALRSNAFPISPNRLSNS